MEEHDSARDDEPSGDEVASSPAPDEGAPDEDAPSDGPLDDGSPDDSEPATPDAEAGESRSSPAPDREFLRRDRLTLVVGTIAILALALRFVDLGVRVAHWQEARLGWWIDVYARTGTYPGRPALGGSLLQILGRVTTDVLGTSDLAIRAPVALVGGLLPLGALAFRRRLDDLEVALVAGLLAVAPLLVYYTRFASVDALAAGLAVATVAVVVALRDRPRAELVLAAVLAGVLTVAAAPTAAIGHLVALVLAWALTLVAIPPSRFAAGAEPTGEESDIGVPDEPSPFPLALVDAWREGWTIAVPVGLLLLLLLLDPGLPEGVLANLTDPGALVGVVLGPVVALVGYLELVVAEVFAAPGTVGAGVDLLATLVFAAPVVTGLAVVGGLAERWTDRPARPVVVLALAWGALGVPLHLVVSGAGTPWVATHVVVALVVPAAVGAAATVRWTRSALADGDPLTGATGLLTLVLVVGVLGAALVSGVYLSPTDPAAGPVQYGQPSQDLRGPLSTLDARARFDARADLVLYGPHFVDAARLGLQPRCARWYNALPLPWYAAVSDADVDCASSAQELRTLLGRDPTLVVGREDDLAPIAPGLTNYTATTIRFRAWNANTTVLVRDEGD